MNSELLIGFYELCIAVQSRSTEQIHSKSFFHFFHLTVDRLNIVSYSLCITINDRFNIEPTPKGGKAERQDMNTTTKKTEMLRSDFRKSGVSRQELTCYYVEKMISGPNFPYSREFIEQVELCLEHYAVVYEDEIVAVEMRAEAEASRLRVLVKDVLAWKANK